VTTPEHRPAPPPRAENTVLAEPATVEQAADDYADRTGGTNPGQVSAAPHTHGRQ
jgi:hypothetical protein